MLKHGLEQESVCKLHIATRDDKQNIYCVQYNFCFVLTFLCELAYKREFFLCVCMGSTYATVKTKKTL